jgi:tetratricopeptide (TPR) repeat protein
MAPSIKAAWKAYEADDRERAETLFQEVTSRATDSSHPHTQCGLFFLRLERYKEASESFQKASEIQPENPAPIFFLALSQELAGERDEFRATLEKLSEVSPHHQGCSSLELLAEIRGGDPTSLLAEFGFGPQDGKAPQKLTHRMAAALGKGDPKWLPSDLTSSDYLLGPILVEVESRLHALEIPKLEHHAPLLAENLDELVPPKRNFAEEFSRLGDSFRAGNALKKGKKLLEKAWGIGDPVEQKIPLKAALVLLRTARKADPRTFRVSYHLAETYILLSKVGSGEPYDRFRLLQAQSSCLASAKNEGVNPYLLFYLAYVQHLLGRPILGIQYYKEATKKFEKLPEAHYGQGQCELLLGNRKAARELFLKAVNSDLALARERLDLFASLLAEKGPEAFEKPLPEMPPEPVETEPEPEATESEPEPEATESEPEPEAAESEPEPEAAESEPEPEATESEPEPENAEVTPETDEQVETQARAGESPETD